MENYIIEMKGITKRFPGVTALDNVTLQVTRGEVLALVGENGAGKSTLMKCLMGIYRQDEGTVLFDGKEVNFKSTLEALNLGISMIHQELSTVPNRSVMHNIWIGREPKNRFGLVDHNRIFQQTQELFRQLGLDIDPRQMMNELTVARMQMVEIARAQSYDAKVIIMDEPTSSLTQSEAERLFQMIDKLKSGGAAIVYISHKLDEIFKIADSISIMRDGKTVTHERRENLTPDEMIGLMVGRKLEQMFPKVDCEIGEVRMQVSNYSCSGHCEDVSFTLRRGEILGLAGLVGAGRTELMETVFGIRGKASGELTLDGKTIEIRRPEDAIQHGLAFLTEDRRETGIYPMLDIVHNTTIAASKDYRNRVKLLDTRRMRGVVSDYVAKLKVKTPYLHTAIQNLSGGNQQKVLIARWLLTDPNILILDEPTRGIDVGAKAEIHTLITQMAAAGKSIIMISSELPEIIGMCDRVVVMHEGKKTGELERSALSQEAIMKLAVS